MILAEQVWGPASTTEKWGAGEPPAHGGGAAAGQAHALCSPGSNRWRQQQQRHSRAP